MTHTAESDAEIVRRRAAGETYAVIGRALGMSKNAVLGRALRKLPVRVQPKEPPPPPRETQDFPPLGRCRFSTERQVPYHFCGAPTGSIEKPWCPEHMAVVYLPAKKVEA